VDLRELLRTTAHRIGNIPAHSPELINLVGAVRDVLTNRGLGGNCHVGGDFSKDVDGEMTLEWYAGALVDIYDNKAWYAMNSWINCVDKFAQKKP